MSVLKSFLGVLCTVGGICSPIPSPPFPHPSYSMTTAKKISTAPDHNDKLRKYRLTPDELRDESKLRTKIISTKSVFSYGTLAANASGVPGLGAVLVALEGVRASTVTVPCMDGWSSLSVLAGTGRQLSGPRTASEVSDLSVSTMFSPTRALSSYAEQEKMQVPREQLGQLGERRPCQHGIHGTTIARRHHGCGRRVCV